MNRGTFLLALFAAGLANRLAGADDALAQAGARATTEFTARIQAATTELAATQERIAQEKKPLLDALRTADARIATLDPEIARLETLRAQADGRRQKLQREEFALQKNIAYLNSLARDSGRGVADGLQPGEAPAYADRVAALVGRCEAAPKAGDTAAAMATVDLMVERLRRQIGGYTVPGECLRADDRRVVRGTFALLGPDVFFRAADGRVAGMVRTREGSSLPVVHALRGWSPAGAAALFDGRTGTMLADASGGKALRLRETTGTLAEHVNRGGPVAYIIIGVGVLALGLAGQKLLELRKLRVDAPETMRPVMAALVGGDAAARQHALAKLQPATRELLEIGLGFADQPREVLEENLFAFTLRQRLHYERRLPLLAVIATASPLLGLLGTVMGMIKTFALITVFGTGNAAKLSSGISEVLVTTELGLVVAVPTLVVHGFLSHHAQKKLSLLERYAVEFAAAVAQARRSGAVEVAK